MGIIKNFDSLNSSPERMTVLELVEEALASIQPEKILTNDFFPEDEIGKYKRIFLVGFGKGSALISKIIEGKLGDKLTAGYDIDNVEQKFAKIHFTQGTHPLPSQINLDFTKTVLENIKDLTEEDLVYVVICGGGSALFELPNKATLDELNEINHLLLNSGANISEINAIRKHLSLVKGGGLAKHLYPSHVKSLIFSDVPGNDLSVIASGPTNIDPTSIEDAETVLQKYHLPEKIKGFFQETDKDSKYFKNVENIIALSNLTALNAMGAKAKELGKLARIYSDRVQGDARELGKNLIEETKPGEILIVGGESTVHITGNGKGGRNQTLVAAALPYVDENITIASFDSDGVDFYGFAGAIGDELTKKKAKERNLDPQEFLSKDDTYDFFNVVGDGIDTGKLESNVSDLMIIYKK